MTQQDDLIQTLAAQQALLTEGLRRFCEGRVSGPDGAAAIVDALDPAHAGQWTPVPFASADQ